jgi:hypothetical protein
MDIQSLCLTELNVFTAWKIRKTGNRTIKDKRDDLSP